MSPDCDIKVGQPDKWTRATLREVLRQNAELIELNLQIVKLLSYPAVIIRAGATSNNHPMTWATNGGPDAPLHQ